MKILKPKHEKTKKNPVAVTKLSSLFPSAWGKSWVLIASWKIKRVGASQLFLGWEEILHRVGVITEKHTFWIP